MPGRYVVALVLVGRVANAEEPDDVQDIAPEEPVEPAPPSPPTPAPPPPAPAPTPAKTDHVHTMDEVAIPTSFLRFGINFFGDASFVATTPDDPHTTFAVGALGVRMLGQLSPSLDALAELAFETAGGAPIADIEQIAIRWRSRSVRVEFGRLHTDLGYWNRAYHHGLWLQTPVERPKALRFEDDGGIIPVHWIGIHVALEPRDDVAIVLGAGNGRGDIVDDILVDGESNEAKSALLKVRFKRDPIELGAGAIYDLIAPADAMTRPALPDQKIHELIANAYVVFRGDGPLVIAEGYAVHHRAGGENWMTYVGYALAGFGVTDRVMPYLAIDTIIGGDDDPFFRPDPAMSPLVDVVEVLGGIRVDVSEWSALKAEVRFGSPLDDAMQDDLTGVINWSFGL